MNILNSSTINQGNTPKDIITLRKFLHSLGIEEYEKTTLNFLSEFINTYITDILNEAKKNMSIANRNKINIEDVKLAVNNRQSDLYKSKPSLKVLTSLSKQINEIPLPSIPDSPNVLIPPIENNLLRNNFQIYSEELAQNFKVQNSKRSSSLKIEDVPMLGLKRREFDNQKEIKGKKRIKLSIEGQNSQMHKHRKLSLTQAYKPNKEEDKGIKEDKDDREGEDNDEMENEEDDVEQDDPILEGEDEEREGSHSTNNKKINIDKKGINEIDGNNNNNNYKNKKDSQINTNFELFRNEEDGDDLDDFDFH